jgi:hypothetical protein
MTTTCRGYPHETRKDQVRLQEYPDIMTVRPSSYFGDDIRVNILR